MTQALSTNNFSLLAFRRVPYAVEKNLRGMTEWKNERQSLGLFTIRYLDKAYSTSQTEKNIPKRRMCSSLHFLGVEGKMILMSVLTSFLRPSSEFGNISCTERHYTK